MKTSFWSYITALLIGLVIVLLRLGGIPPVDISATIQEVVESYIGKAELHE